MREDIQEVIEERDALLHILTPLDLQLSGWNPGISVRKENIIISFNQLQWWLLKPLLADLAERRRKEARKEAFLARFGRPKIRKEKP